MFAKWISEDYYVGPKHRKIIAIKKGEIRRVHAKKDHEYVLSGRNDKGFFGWIHEKNIEILRSI